MKTDTINYVAGFLFNEDRTRVALVEKQKPDWQRGKLNAIGGKIEDGEEPLAAMIREFREETGAHVEAWRHFCALKFRGATIHFFETTGSLESLRTVEDEQILTINVRHLSEHPTIRNLVWLIPLALDSDRLSAVIEDPS